MKMNSISYDYNKNAPRLLSDDCLKKSKKQTRSLSQLSNHKTVCQKNENKSFNIVWNKNFNQTHRTKHVFESIPEYPITHQPKMST